MSNLIQSLKALRQTYIKARMRGFSREALRNLERDILRIRKELR